MRDAIGFSNNDLLMACKNIIEKLINNPNDEYVKSQLPDLLERINIKLMKF